MDLLKQNEVEDLLKETYKYKYSFDREDQILKFIRKYGLKREDFDGINPKDTSSFFSEWSKYTKDTLFHKSRLDGTKYATDKWWGIKTKNYDYKSNDNYKIYLPIDYKHLKKGVEILLDFFKSNNIEVDMKISHKMRNDNVIIRVMGYQDALNIINFVEHNNYLVEGRNKLSPTTPSFNTVGLVKDKGTEGSYQSYIAGNISYYIGLKDSDCTYKNYIEYLKNRPPHMIYNEDMEKYFGYTNNYFGQYSNGNKQEETNELNDKINYLLKAIYHTYNKYHSELQLENALVAACNNDFDFFTKNSNPNDPNNVRKELQEHVKPEEIRKLMIHILDSNGIEYNFNMTNQQLAYQLSNNIFVKEQQKENQIKL